jgi:uncharacterized protein YndB with AHSA1/START domain
MTEDFGQVEVDADRAALIFERQLAHSPERVWRALTDPIELKAWYMSQASIEGRPGGRVDMVTGPSQFHWTGQVLVWDPYSVLEYEWNAEPQQYLPDGERSIVRYELERRGGGTLLRLRHSRLTVPTALGFAPGTHALLDRLVAHLGDAPLPNWTTRYDEVKAGYPSWERPPGRQIASN